MNERLFEAWEKFSRRARKATRVSRWPFHSKVAVAAWIPVAVVAFILYTGPYQPTATRGAAAAAAGNGVTTTTVGAPSRLVTPDEMLSAALNSSPPKHNIPTTQQFRVIADALRADHYARLRDEEPMLRAKARTRAAKARVHVAKTRKTVAVKNALQHQISPGHPNK